MTEDEIALSVLYALSGCVVLFGGWKMSAAYRSKLTSDKHRKEMFSQILVALAAIAFLQYCATLSYTVLCIKSRPEFEQLLWRSLWFVADTMAKGLFFDLMESFEISLGTVEVPDRHKLVFQFIVFVCRTLYSLGGAIVLLAVWQGVTAKRSN